MGFSEPIAEEGMEKTSDKREGEGESRRRGVEERGEQGREVRRIQIFNGSLVMNESLFHARKSTLSIVMGAR